MTPSSPVFIGGMYKSGTSLLRAMLGRHSRLFTGLETQWLREDWDGATDDARLDWVSRMALFFDASPDELSTSCGPARDIETCLDRVMGHLTQRAGKSRWVEKSPGNAGVIERILSYWPHAQVLHIIRDPRDVYASMIESRKWVKPDEFAARWCDTVGAARRWLAGQGGKHSAYHELRYERLVMAPAREIAQVLDFLDEPWEPKVAAFDGQPGDFDRVREATGKESPTLRRLANPLTTSRVGVWQQVVPAERWNAVRSELARRGERDLVDELISESNTTV